MERILCFLVVYLVLIEARRQRNTVPKREEVDDLDYNNVEIEYPNKKSGITDYLKLPLALNDQVSENLDTLIGQERIGIENLLVHHYQYDRKRNIQKEFQGEILVYVTPWNRNGYDFSLLMVHYYIISAYEIFYHLLIFIYF